MIASHLPLKLSAKQEILEITDVKKRLEFLINKLHDEQAILDLERKINTRVKEAMERTQKEFYLREQMKAIQKELGDKDGKSIEVVELTKKIEEAGMPDNVKQAAFRELDRYEKVHSASAESGVIRNYIDWLVALPWSDASKDQLDINRSEEILNRDHEGLESVKERILEYLAVRQMTNSLRGPILCLRWTSGSRKDFIGPFHSGIIRS